MNKEDAAFAADALKSFAPLICIVLGGLGWLVLQANSYFSERPMLYVTAVEPLKPTEGQTESGAQVLFTNRGKLPAREVHKKVANLMDRAENISDESVQSFIHDLRSNPGYPQKDVEGEGTYSIRLDSSVPHLALGHVTWTDQWRFSHSVDFCVQKFGDGETGWFLVNPNTCR